MRHPCGGQAEATIACGGIPPHVLDGWAPGRVLLLFELHVWSAIGLARLRRLFGLALVFALRSFAHRCPRFLAAYWLTVTSGPAPLYGASPPLCSYKPGPSASPGGSIAAYGGSAPAFWHDFDGRPARAAAGSRHAADLQFARRNRRVRPHAWHRSLDGFWRSGGLVADLHPGGPGQPAPRTQNARRYPSEALSRTNTQTTDPAHDPLTQVPLPNRGLLDRDWQKALVVLLTLLASLALLWVLWQVVSPILHTLVLFGLAAVLAFGLGGPVGMLAARLGGNRVLAIVLVYLLFGVVIIGGLVVLAGPFVRQASGLVTALPQYAIELH